MTESKRLPALDGVRGLAILGVLLMHFVHHPAGTSTFALRAIKQATLLSWAGVDLFFVLSGFLITGILLDTKARPDYYRRFWQRRAARILPLYYLLLLAVFALPPLRVHAALAGPAPAYVLLWQNVWMARHGLGGVVLAFTWSLAVEEQFYFVLPFLVRGLSTRNLGRLFVGLILTAPLLRCLWGMPAAFVLLPCRADALAWGGLIALVVRRPAWRPQAVFAASGALGVGAVAAGVALYCGTEHTDPGMYRFGYSFLDLGAAGLVALAVLKPAEVLLLRPLRYLGTVAYGLYLLHIPALLVAHRVLGTRQVPIESVRGLLWGAGLPVGLALIAAAVSWRFVEEPFIRLARRHDNGRAAPR
jgi:peptidoglycan/LPS O-acetylase OafA/YrhL